MWKIFESAAVVNGVEGEGRGEGGGRGRGASYFLASAKHLAARQARRILGSEGLPGINCQLLGSPDSSAPSQTWQPFKVLFHSGCWKPAMCNADFAVPVRRRN